MMKIVHISIALLLFLISFSLQGKEHTYPPFMTSSDDFLEKVELITDRDIYFIEEKLFFHAKLQSNYNDWSKIIYIQLISYNGNVFHQSKHRLAQDGSIQGAINIPREMLTGYYYIRAYTKWMRNYSQYNYFYKPILIINSQEEQVLAVDEGYCSEVKLDTISDNYMLISTVESTLNSYSEKKHITSENLDRNYSNITLVREELMAQYWLSIKRMNDSIFEYHYPPEINGLTLTGKIIDDSLNVDLSRTSIFFSVLGENPQSSVMKTDKNGQFYFNIKDYFGHKESILSISSKNVGNVKFLVDNDFCVKKIQLPYISPLTLGQKQWEHLGLSNANAQVEKRIIISKEEKQVADFKKQKLYSLPTLAININDYIAMPTIKDYIYELIPMLGIKYKEDIPEIFIRNSTIKSKAVDNRVLIIYDGVFVRDIASIMNVSPSQLKSIEVFNRLFLLGDETFGGILSIESKKKKFADLELKDNGVFINFQMLDENVYKERLPQKLNKRELLYNNTVLWSTSEDENRRYLLPDRKGKYLLVLSNWDNGKFERVALKLLVR